MPDSSRQKAAAAEIARLRSDVEKYAAYLDQPADRFLDAQFISFHTGIPPERVRELLEGALPEPEPQGKEALEEFQKNLFRARLNFLRSTRTKVTPQGEEPFSLREIAEGTSISYQMVSLLLSGKRSPNAAHADRLEKFFDRASQQRTPPSSVPRGFCHRDEATALLAHLTQMVHTDLRTLVLATLADEFDSTSVALRGTGEIDVVTLLPVLAQLREDARARRGR
ncbi:helix-turn-helix transcriptional regulator [Streptomyces sp. NPDC045251]|uniref:helix-turn-helix domain-containing protein n=1 Tax=unclassified Streptomyces TaxID=2593676 RepID=UPI0033FAD8F8